MECDAEADDQENHNDQVAHEIAVAQLPEIEHVHVQAAELAHGLQWLNDLAEFWVQLLPVRLLYDATMRFVGLDPGVRVAAAFVAVSPKEGRSAIDVLRGSDLNSKELDCGMLKTSDYYRKSKVDREWVPQEL